MLKSLMPAILIVASAAPVVFAHPAAARDARVERAAFAVERQAHRAARLAALRGAHRGTFLERTAYARLVRLEQSAHRFRRVVERRGLRGTRDDAALRRLLRDYYRAEDALGWLRTGRRLRVTFARMEAPLDRLRRAYGIESFAWYSRATLRHRHQRAHRHDGAAWRAR